MHVRKYTVLKFCFIKLNLSKRIIFRFILWSFLQITMTVIDDTLSNTVMFYHIIYSSHILLSSLQFIFESILISESI